MSSSSMRRSVPLGVFSAHRLAGRGQLTLMWIYSLLGLDVCSVEGDDAAQPLHVAAYNGEREVVEWLLRSQRVPVTVCTASGWQAVHCAAAGGYLPTLQLLVDEAGASASARTQPQLLTPLMCSAVRGQLRCVRFLCHHPKAEVTAATRDGHTALHFAAASGNAAVLRTLLTSTSSSSDASPSSSFPSSPLSTPLLSVDAVDGEGRSALHWAMRRGHAECARLLLRSGADLGREDSGGLDAFALAVRGGWPDCVRLGLEEEVRRGRGPLDEAGQRQTALQLLQAALDEEERRSGSGRRTKGGVVEAEKEGGEDAEAVDFVWTVGEALGSGAESSADRSMEPPAGLLQRLREVRALLDDWTPHCGGSEGLAGPQSRSSAALS